MIIENHVDHVLQQKLGFVSLCALYSLYKLETPPSLRPSVPPFRLPFQFLFSPAVPLCIGFLIATAESEVYTNVTMYYYTIPDIIADILYSSVAVYL